MNHLRNTLILLSTVGLLAACGGNAAKDEKKTEPEAPAAPAITLSKVVDSPDFPNAKLVLESPANGERLDTGNIAFDFTIEGNYEIGAQTLDAEVKGCANSAKGQHIHLILNNKPYTAHYGEDFNRKIMYPGHYVALSFISRSYHESIKTPDAYVVSQFSVGVEHEEKDLSGEHLFYSRPKGTYKGADTKNIMLDFYLVNTEISAEGNKVKATINETEFIIDEWVPYFIEGLPMGENTIKLELIDAQGNPIPGPFNTVTRTIKLEEAGT